MTEVLRDGFRRAADAAVVAAVGGRGGTFYPVGDGVHWSHACSVRVVQDAVLAEPEFASGMTRYGGTRPCPGSVLVRVSLPGGTGSMSFKGVGVDPWLVAQYLEHFVENGPEAVLRSVRGLLLELTGSGVLWEDLVGFALDSPAAAVMEG